MVTLTVRGSEELSQLTEVVSLRAFECRVSTVEGEPERERTEEADEEVPED